MQGAILLKSETGDHNDDCEPTTNTALHILSNLFCLELGS